ncbi:MAG: NAD(P)/FAD-dependent oxidoreductase [Carbonactinosporaceae bacterium]
MADGAFVIVGASLAGAKAAETLRSEGFEGRVVLIGAEPERPYERPPLSKGYLLGQQERDKVYVHDERWYADHDVELLLGTRVESIDRAARTVTAGGATYGYGKLLLATGARPRRLPVPGADLDGVHTLRTVGDSELIRDAVRGGGRVVVVGAGWIGLEVAAAARSYGATVTVVEPQPTPLHGVLGPELGEVFARLHRDNGTELRLGRAVQEIRGDGGRAVGVTLDDGTRLDADAVIVGVGVLPNSGLAEAAGLATDNGVLVDEALRTDDPDIYAAGDVANASNPLLGRRLRVEHWANALNSGPLAARAMLGRQVVYDRVPYFFTDQYDLGMEYSGHAAPGEYDEVVYRGDTDTREFVAFWLRGGRVLAGMNVNVWDVTSPIQELVRAGTQVEAARLADPDTPLTELVR